METHDGSDASATRPTPEEASAALREVEQVRSSLDVVPVPGWYMPLLALLAAGSALAQLLPTAVTVVVVLIMVAGIGATVRLYVQKVGFLRQVKGREVWPAVVPLVVIYLAAAVLDLAYGQEWGWIVAAVLGGGTILGIGYYHQRRVRRQA
ncbi:tellurite resistance protein TehA-like permease [Streptosporangium album]|uniref:Tellurite resistance protein TehA-like permease n=1 Tax=Streptosporangium album TaxID=47479 RepID=A0A7W7RV05_9ACTN|nr:hypothetical protein [Streptosporangium album]MBB4938748.1 tellurite resistance protein TehA-like permease [Streptosporangium album]